MIFRTICFLAIFLIPIIFHLNNAHAVEPELHRSGRDEDLR